MGTVVFHHLVVNRCRDYFEYFCCPYPGQFHRNWLTGVNFGYHFQVRINVNHPKAKWETSASVTNEQGVQRTIFKNSMLEMYKGWVLL